MRNDDLKPNVTIGMLPKQTRKYPCWKGDAREQAGVRRRGQARFPPQNIKRWCSISSRPISYAECQLSVTPCALSYTHRKLKEYHTVQIGFSKIKSMGVLDEPLTLEAKVVLSNYPRIYP